MLSPFEEHPRFLTPALSRLYLCCKRKTTWL